MTEPVNTLRPPAPRWTHIALRVGSVDESIRWYGEFTPLAVLHRRSDAAGHGAWLGHPDAADRPFVLVLAEFFPESDPFGNAPREVLAPFAHLGFELTSQDEVDAVAERAGAAGCLAMPPTQMPQPIGYICMLRDPDGNMIEFSYDQGVYAKAREVWGAAADR